MKIKFDKDFVLGCLMAFMIGGGITFTVLSWFN